MNTVIKDLTFSTDDEKKLKPIELVSCLQGSKNEEGKHYFHTSEQGYEKYIRIPKTISRVARNVNNENHDLIICDGQIVFLGYWNDGVI